ncbi:MAG: threonine--tRNA ligase [Nitrospinota bacterium]|nr:MAG: threonine--tRNA ligase [Nitrospinota bacterium]
MRIQAIVRELKNEKIDVINWSSDPELFISRALSPAKPLFVTVDKQNRTATAIIPDEQVSFYKDGDFVDLCRGPHLPSTGKIHAFKLLSVAGAYWRGDERNKMLQRIYGTAFPSQTELTHHLQRLAEARKRDHRVLGKQLGLFLIHEKAGAGLVYWQPKGTTIRKVIERFWEDEHIKRGYQIVAIPHIVRHEIFKTSGHYDFYREHMYVLQVDEEEYVLKPMNCPGHILLYQEAQRSYRDLPIRFAELGTVYRYEKSGVLHGMLRVRGFTQDDAHIFCTPEQLQEELHQVLDLAQFMLNTFGYEEFEVDLSCWDPANPQNYAGEAEEWDRAQEALRKALEERGMAYTVREGEAAFYGPKIDIKMLDALGRGWQGPTIQFDFNLPRRFDVTYIGPDGNHHHVVMIHRTVLGSMERFVGGLIEHYAGAFPVWLAPVQARLLPITDRQIPYVQQVLARLLDAGIRAEADLRNEKIGYKIRAAQLEKIPYMLVVGDREVAAGTVAVRTLKGGDQGPVPLDEVIATIREAIAKKTV